MQATIKMWLFAFPIARRFIVSKAISWYIFARYKSGLAAPACAGVFVEWSERSETERESFLFARGYNIPFASRRNKIERHTPSSQNAMLARTDWAPIGHHSTHTYSLYFFLYIIRIWENLIFLFENPLQKTGNNNILYKKKKQVSTAHSILSAQKPSKGILYLFFPQKTSKTLSLYYSLCAKQKYIRERKKRPRCEKEPSRRIPRKSQLQRLLSQDKA